MVLNKCLKCHEPIRESHLKISLEIVLKLRMDYGSSASYHSYVIITYTRFAYNKKIRHIYIFRQYVNIKYLTNSFKDDRLFQFFISSELFFSTKSDI